MDGILPPKKNKGRERALDDAEIKGYWLAADEICRTNINMFKTGLLFGSFFKLLLLTGQRRNEVAGMEWSELDLTEGVWTIASHRAKNGKSHIVHLNQLAIDIIKQIPQTHPKFVFTKTQHSHINGFATTKEKLDSMTLTHLGKEFPHFTLHDIRRTFTTKLAELGVKTDIADRILNHVSGSFGGVKGIYQRYEFLPERKEAMEKWNNYIEQLIMPKPL
jgi:integrase